MEPTSDEVRAATERLLRGDVGAYLIQSGGSVSASVPWPGALLPGSFNPVHAGHWQLAHAAAALLGRPVAFELSVTNVDKPPLSLADLTERLAQFEGRADLWITRAPTFVLKARLFPGTTFVVGADTAARLVAARYYQGSQARMVEALQYVRQQGCRFLVAGREDPTGTFVKLEDLQLPGSFRDLFSGIPQEAFHVPLSSTRLREQGPASEKN